MSFVNQEKKDRIFRIALHERFKTKELYLKEVHEVLVRHARLGPMDIDVNSRILLKNLLLQMMLLSVMFNVGFSISQYQRLRTICLPYTEFPT